MADKSQWFRVSTRITDSKKIHDLSDAHFRWVMLFWAEARKNDGILPSIEEMSFHLRRPSAKIQQAVSQLEAMRFIDRIDGHLVPHDWDEWQREDATSTDRVKRFRERHRNGSETKNETPLERDETVPRARSEQNRAEQSRTDRAKTAFQGTDSACAEYIRAYPERGRKKPGLVERWYAANVGLCVDPPKLHAEIMAGLERAKRSAEWEKSEGRYVCGMMPFLEGKRWLEAWPESDGGPETPLTNLEDLE